MQESTNIPGHLLAEIESQENYEDITSKFTITTLKNRTEKIWTHEKFDQPVPVVNDGDRHISSLCAMQEIKQQIQAFSSRMPGDNKLKWRSKYLAGSCVVYVAFLNGPTIHFKNDPHGKRIPNFIGNINTSLANINALKRNDGQPFSHTKFTTISDGYAHDTDVDVPPGIEVIKNIKQFLHKKGYFSGTIDTNQTWDFLQSLQNFMNNLRDYYNTDWGIFLVCNAGNARCWADASPYGMAYLSEQNPYLPQTTLHEILHLFGASDEYPSAKDCDTQPYGWYDAGNYNCSTNEGKFNCMMGNYKDPIAFTGKGKICKATAEQLSLIDWNGTTFRPQREKIVHVYNLKEEHLKSNIGTWLTADLIRKDGSVEVSVKGSTKMNPWYNAHGPEGDLKTIVGSDHLLPGEPFSCAIGRWRSFDGKNVTPWMKVGSGGVLKAPYTGFFTIAVNDKKDNFGDNSGYLDVTLKSLLRDNYGPCFVYPNNRTDEIMLDAAAYAIESSD